MQLSLPNCDQAKAFMRGMARGENRGALGYVVPLTNSGVPAPKYTIIDFWENPANLLKSSLGRLVHQRWGHDFGVPMIDSVIPYGGGVLATAFGARFIPSDNYTLPCIASADEVDTLPTDVTLADGLIPRALEAIEYVVDRTGGQIPIQMYNTGGPLDIVSMATGYENLLIALRTHPDVMRRLLDVATDLYIDFVNAQRRIVPEFVPMLLSATYWPDGAGIFLGADFLGLIGPHTALEWEIPYINRISDAFGGVIVHADRMLEVNYQVLRDHVRNLRGVHFNGGESSFPQAVEVFRGTDVVIFTRLQVNRPYRFDSRLDFARHVLSTKTVDVSVFLDACQAADPMLVEDDPEAMSEEILALIERYVNAGRVVE